MRSSEIIFHSVLRVKINIHERSGLLEDLPFSCGGQDLIVHSDVEVLRFVSNTGARSRIKLRVLTSTRAMGEVVCAQWRATRIEPRDVDSRRDRALIDTLSSRVAHTGSDCY